MRTSGKAFLARRTMLGFWLLLWAGTSAPAQDDPSGLRAEVQQLNASMARLVAMVEGWTAEAGRSERLRQVDDLDRSIAFLDGELRARKGERAELEMRLDGLVRAMDRTEERLHEGSEPGFMDLLEAEVDPEKRLELQERQVRRIQQDLVPLDARILEIQSTLNERRDMREQLATRLQREIAADRTGSR